MSLNNITDSKTFCPCPWTDLHFKKHSAVTICSYSNPIGSLTNNSIEELSNGPVINEIKNAISNEQWHPNCNYCQHHEEQQGNSERYNQLRWLDDDTKQWINAHPTDRLLKRISLDWDNLCNLACNYCSPYQSSTWGKKLNIPTNRVAITQQQDKFNLVINYLLDNKQTLEHILLLGGEPLVQDQFASLLDGLASNKQYFLNIATNLSIPLEINPLYKLIASKKNLGVNWLVSFDNIGNKFEYVRDGAKWTTFYNNLKLLKQNNQHLVTAHPAYGIYCALDIEEYYDFCVEHELPIFLCNIDRPIELNIAYAPKLIRDQAIEQIDRVLSKYSDRADLGLDTLTHYRNMVATGAPIEKMLGDNKDVSTNDSVRAKAILTFTEYLEKTLTKTVFFKDLWPEAHDILVNLMEEAV